ncbi:MAG: hypothetical protein IIW27_00920, partial [Clostridia bacterium]|nr:hypothetical protein [Clostridia bacterium]
KTCDATVTFKFVGLERLGVHPVKNARDKRHKLIVISSKRIFFINVLLGPNVIKRIAFNKESLQ